MARGLDPPSCSGRMDLSTQLAKAKWEDSWKICRKQDALNPPALAYDLRFVCSHSTVDVSLPLFESNYLLMSLSPPISVPKIVRVNS